MNLICGDYLKKIDFFFEKKKSIFLSPLPDGAPLYPSCRQHHTAAVPAAADLVWGAGRGGAEGGRQDGGAFRGGVQCGAIPRHGYRRG